jgi:hypothetical protein
METAAALSDAADHMVQQFQQLLTTGESNPDPQRIKQMLTTLAPERLYWSRLEVSFRRFFLDLADHPAEGQRILARWVSHTLRSAAGEAYDELAGQP